MFKSTLLYVLCFFCFLFTQIGQSETSTQTLVIGSKKFTENYILAEIMAQLLEHHHYKIDRRFGMNSSIVYRALKKGDVDIYPEYTGTISRVYLKTNQNLTSHQINDRLKKLNLSILKPFGFNNTYAIAIPEELSKNKNLKTIEDLKDSNLKGAITFEFSKREDGWPGLSRAYAINLDVTSMEHSLAYEAIKNNKADFTDAYSTDAKLKRFNLVILKDTKEFFPKYHAIPFIKNTLPQKVKDILYQLSNLINETQMIELNAQAEYGGKSFEQIASNFLIKNNLITQKKVTQSSGLDWSTLFQQTQRHLFLTFLAILLGVIVAVPLGIMLFRFKLFARPILVAAGLLQTIPSIALLAFMIPVFGIGVKPAVAALFLFSILPILRNTYAALDNIDPHLNEAAQGMGLYPNEILRFVHFPLSIPIILTGIRTAAVINIGTATLAAFIGAGGLGESIVTGLALNNNEIILQGAIPAAILAIFTELFFEALEMWAGKKY